MIINRVDPLEAAARILEVHIRRQKLAGDLTDVSFSMEVFDEATVVSVARALLVADEIQELLGNSLVEMAAYNDIPGALSDPLWRRLKRRGAVALRHWRKSKRGRTPTYPKEDTRASCQQVPAAKGL